MPFVDHFSLIAPYYDRVFRRPSVDLLLRHVDPESGNRMLDVGGGTGRIAQVYVGLVAQVCVVDPSPLMLREGQRKGICTTQGESEYLPFASGTFDRILMVDAFHHLCDQRIAVRELVRVLAPGGRLVIEEPDIAHWGVWLVALAEKLLLMRSHFVAPDGIRGMFAGCAERAWVAKDGFTAWVVVEKA